MKLRRLNDSPAYKKLVADLRRVKDSGIKSIEEFLDKQRILSSWETGRTINTYLAKNELPRGGVSQFYATLSDDLEINDRTLQHCEQFFRYFPKLKIEKGLTWSHYRFLLVEPDAAKRRIWIERIKKEKIVANDLRLMLLPPVELGDELGEFDLKEPTRGKLYTYGLLNADDVENFEEPWFVDLGFSNRREAPAYENRRTIWSKIAVTNGIATLSIFSTNEARMIRRK